MKIVRTLLPQSLVRATMCLSVYSYYNSTDYCDVSNIENAQSENKHSFYPDTTYQTLLMNTSTYYCAGKTSLLCWEERL